MVYSLTNCYMYQTYKLSLQTLIIELIGKIWDRVKLKGQNILNQTFFLYLFFVLTNLDQKITKPLKFAVVYLSYVNSCFVFFTSKESSGIHISSLKTGWHPGSEVICTLKDAPEYTQRYLSLFTFLNALPHYLLSHLFYHVIILLQYITGSLTLPVLFPLR